MVFCLWGLDLDTRHDSSLCFRESWDSKPPPQTTSEPWVLTLFIQSLISWISAGYITMRSIQKPRFFPKKKQNGLTLKCRSWRSIPGFQVMCTLRRSSTKAIGGIVWNMIFHSTVIIYCIYIYTWKIYGICGIYNIMYGKYMENIWKIYGNMLTIWNI